MGVDVLDVRHADDVVAVAAEDRHAAVAGFPEQRNECREAVVDVEDHHVGTRHADVTGLAFAKVEHVLQHGAFDGGKVVARRAIIVMVVDGFFKAFAQRRFVVLAGDQEAQRAPQS